MYNEDVFVIDGVPYVEMTKFPEHGPVLVYDGEPMVQGRIYRSGVGEYFLLDHKNRLRIRDEEGWSKLSSYEALYVLNDGPLTPLEEWKGEPESIDVKVGDFISFEDIKKLPVGAAAGLAPERVYINTGEDYPESSFTGHSNNYIVLYIPR